MLNRLSGTADSQIYSIYLIHQSAVLPEWLRGRDEQ